MILSLIFCVRHLQISNKVDNFKDHQDKKSLPFLSFEGRDGTPEAIHRRFGGIMLARRCFKFLDRADHITKRSFNQVQLIRTHKRTLAEMCHLMLINTTPSIRHRKLSGLTLPNSIGVIPAQFDSSDRPPAPRGIIRPAVRKCDDVMANGSIFDIC